MAPRPLSPSGTDRNPVKFWVLMMFFGAGVGLAVLGLLLPDGPGAQPALGRALMVGNGVCSLIALALLLTARRRPPLKRFDLPLLLLAQAATLGGVLGETFLFGTQFSIMTQLWVTVFAAGFLPRRLVWAQQVLGLASIALMVWMRAQYGATPPRLWGVDALVTALPVVLTGVAVAYFRGEAEREARALEAAGRTDPLTGLGNRRALFESFGIQQSGTQRLTGLVMLDLDHFKRVNDRYGHAEGDRVIRVLADVLREHAAPHDLLTRHGGEEFVWVTGVSDEQELLGRVNALRVSFAQRIEGLGVTVSAGVAVTSLPLDDPASVLPELLRRADAALYQAKAAGRDQARLAS